MANIQLNYTLGGDESTSDSQLRFNIYNYGVLWLSLGSSETESSISVAGGVATIDLVIANNTAYDFSVSEVDVSGNVGPQSNNISITSSQVLKSIMTGFKVKNSTPNQVHFNTPLGNVDGISILDFKVSYRTITKYTKVSETEAYFTLSGPLTFWNISTIEKTGGDNSVVNDFTLEYIDNTINTPTAPNVKWASSSGSGSKNGTSEDNAWDFTQMDNLAAPGDHVYVKAGARTGTLFFSSSGEESNPIIYEGYKTSIPGGLPVPITSNYMKGADINSWDDDEMPTIVGTSRLSDRGMELRGLSFVIFRNFQVRDCAMGIIHGNTYGINESIVFENVNGKYFGNSSTQADEPGYFYNAYDEPETGDKIQLINCVSINASQSHILTMGNNWLIKGHEGHNNQAGNLSEVDYFCDLQGDRNVVKDVLFHRYDGLNPSPAAGSFGVSIKARRPNANRTARWNLVDGAHVIGCAEAINFRWRDSEFNVVKNCTLDGGTQPAAGGVAFRDGASHNTFENSIIKNPNQDWYGAIQYFDSQGEDGTGQTLENNIVRNCIIVGGGAYEEATTPAIHFGLGRNGGSSDAPWIVKDCKIQHCTFKNIPEMFSLNYNVTLDNFEMTNCIIDGVPIRNATNNPTINETNNNYWDFWGTNGVPPSGVGNESINPQLDSGYKPLATFTSIDAPAIPGIYYDKDGEERNITETTKGAILSDTEVV